MSETAKKSLVSKLAEVMGEVDRIPKSGRNNFHNYDYATEADIVAAVRGAMAKRFVMLFSSVEKVEWSDAIGGKQKIATLTVKFTFHDGESDETIEFTGMGQGADASDKAIYKAFTGAEKYALLKTFLIPTGDDPEKDDAPPKNSAKPRPPAPPKSNAAPLPTPAQVHAAAARSAAPAVPELTPYQRCVLAGRGFAPSFDEHSVKEAIKKVFPIGKTKASDLTHDDVSAVVQYMEKLRNPSESGRDAGGASPVVASPQRPESAAH